MKKIITILIAAAFLLGLFFGCQHQPVEESVDVTTDTQPQIVYTLQGSPVKTIYVSGEAFDPTGLYVTDNAGNVYLANEIDVQGILSDGASSATVSYFGNTQTVPITVIEGEPHAFQSSVSEQENSDAIHAFTENCKGVRDIAEAYDASYLIKEKITNPFPDGHVRSLEELTQYVDYHVFYGISSVVAFLDYSYDDLEDEITKLYFKSGLLPGSGSVQAYRMGGGAVQILIRYYRDHLFVVPQENLTAEYLTPYRKKHGTWRYSEPHDGVTVYSSDQAVYALENGYEISPVPGSPAEALLEAANAILSEYYHEEWTDEEKLFHIFLYFADHCTYDAKGSMYAAYVCDYVHESDLLMSQVASFKAEGPILYNNGACYGFAKAASVLLSLEGFDVRRVVSMEEGVEGRSSFRTDDIENGTPVISTHSYLYVNVNGKDYLFDPTFSFAGSYLCNGDRITRIRNMCISQSIEEHRQIYENMMSDWYAETDEYVRAGAEYTKALNIIIDSRSDAEFVDKYLASRVVAGKQSKYYNLSVLINASKYDLASANETIDYLVSRRCEAYISSQEEITIGGTGYYSYIITMYVAGGA